MATARPNSYVNPSWLAKLLSGDASCAWAAWFRAHYKHDKLPSNFDLARWVADHTELVRRAATDLREDSYIVTVEDQNSFWLPNPAGTIVLSGKPDLVALKGTEALVVDAKTGRPRPSDVQQVLVYMAALPFIRNGAYRQYTVAGRVAYPSHEVEIPPAAVNDEFLTRLRRTIATIGGPEPLPRVPSPRECNWCDIGPGDCPERMNTDVLPVLGDQALFL